MNRVKSFTGKDFDVEVILEEYKLMVKDNTIKRYTTHASSDSHSDNGSDINSNCKSNFDCDSGFESMNLCRLLLHLSYSFFHSFCMLYFTVFYFPHRFFISLRISFSNSFVIVL